MTITVYTTVLGKTKPLHEADDMASDGRFICFTDQPIESRLWQIVRLPPTPTPARECRRLKALSHVVFPEADTTLWMDSSFVLNVDPDELAKKYPHPITTFRHPHRARISDEARVIIEFGKARPEDISRQLADYQADGFDTSEFPQTSISAGGFILRRHTEEVKRFNEFWHQQIQTHTLRDQMSIDYSAWKTGLEIRYFPGDYLTTEYARLTRMQVPAQDF